MTPDRLNDEVLARLEISRRELVRRLVVGTAFAVPVVASFDMAALSTSSAEALTPNQAGAFTSNQTFAAPAFTSAAAATFEIGKPGSIEITASGGPSPAITCASQFPAGLSLTDHNDGSAALSGTPGQGSGGVYDLSLLADNGINPRASQVFALTVQQPPVFTSSATATLRVDHAGEVLIAATGYPVPMITKSGSLPAGLSFHADNIGGSAIISGTPKPGTQGVHKLTLTAANGLTPAGRQHLTLTIHRKS